MKLTTVSDRGDQSGGPAAIDIGMAQVGHLTSVGSRKYF